MKAKHIYDQSYDISREDRSVLLENKPALFWFTGLSGSGKSTLANAFAKALHDKSILTYTLDGDNVRAGLNNDLTFSPEDRTENIRRIAEVAKLFVDAGVVVLAAFVSPYEKDRQRIREIVGAGHMMEVYVKTSLEECERRDVKGLYKKARSGEIKNFTGIDAVYEEPSAPEITIQTEYEQIDEAVKKMLNFALAKIASKNE